MLKNYLKVALRNILKHRLFSVITILGLSVSMATCLLIILLIYSQKKRDSFHEKGDRIVRVLSLEDSRSFASTPLPLGNMLSEDYPHLIEDAVQIRSSFVGGDMIFGENRIPLAGRYVDDRFFAVFDFNLIAGDVATVLQAPFSIVLTKNSAEKLFGETNPIGKSVKLSDIGLNTMGIDVVLTENKENVLGDFVVTGITDNSLPSHIQFDFLISASTLPSLVKQGKSDITFDTWENYFDAYLYLVLKKGVSEKDLQPILNAIASEKYTSLEDVNITFAPEKLSQINLSKFHQNPMSLRMPVEVIYVLSFLGIIVLFSACFNYVNLSFTRSLARSKEIGVRKTMGAARYQVFVQFMMESILVGLLSLAFAIGLLQLLSRMFLNLWINRFLILDFRFDIALFLVFILFSIVVGLMAGVFPASFLSSFSPIKTLRNAKGITLGKGKGLPLRKGLVVLQFCASLLFIITTLLIFSQLNYLMEKEYGFNQDHVINLKLQGIDHGTLADELSKNPSIQGISASSFVPGTGGYSGGVLIKNRFSESQSDVASSFIAIDQNFIPNLKIPLKAGTNFPSSMPKNSEEYVILNEAAARLLGHNEPKAVVGETILLGEDQTPVEVIGLTANFIYDLLMEAEPTDPLIMRYLPHEFAYLNIRYAPTASTKSIISYIEHKWKSMDKVHSLKYNIYEDELKGTNAIFSDIIYIFGFVSFLTITISMLGLLGIAAFTAVSKRKEISIRKVHGAQAKNITYLLSKGFLPLFIIAVLVTVPLSYFVNVLWLEAFAYKVNFSPWIFIIGVGIMFTTGFGTILSQTLSAANDTTSLLKRLKEE
ncbi:MAG: ABC transporter permease [Bacteroidota bacterium]